MQAQTAPQQLKPYIKWLIITACLTAALVASWFIWSRFLNKKLVALQPTPGTTITLGKPNSEGRAITQPIIETTQLSQVRVQPGIYAVVFSGDGYVSSYKELEITGPTTIETPELSYTSERLAAELPQQAPAIHAIIASLPELKGYTTTAEQLYGQGQWYGATLAPPNPATRDTLRVILQKQDSVWQVAAGPAIVFYIGDYPRIPAYVVRGVNNN